LAKESRNTTEKQNEIIKMSLDIDLIKEISPGIYTSNGIQKRIKEVSKERSDALKDIIQEKKEPKKRSEYQRKLKIN